MTYPTMFPQGSANWIAVRLGKVTASRVADACARTKNGFGAKRDEYMAELICERLTGAPVEHYVSAAMQRGTELEPEARAAYCFHADCDVTQVGFVPHPDIAMAGASPDGYVGDDGLVEIKCPSSATHLATLLGGAIDKRYLDQMQFQLACTGRAWVDFVSYDNRFPGAMSLCVQRVPRDGVLIAALENDVAGFLAELDQKLAALNARFAPEPEPTFGDGLGIPEFLRRAS